LKAEALELDQQMMRLRQVCAGDADGFAESYGDQIEDYRAAVREGVRDFTKLLEGKLSEISDGNQTCAELGVKTSEYLDWLQWTFWDLPYFAFCLHLPSDRVRDAVCTCGMAYLSLRIMDDVVDRHFVYKGHHPTLLASFDKQQLGQQRAEGSTVLAGLLVCFSGLIQLAERRSPIAQLTLERALESLRRATIGALMEMSPREHWTEAYYERMIRLKNVEFWRVLYAGLDPEYASPLYPFLERYYVLAQMLNDVQDFTDDEKRGQPNLVSMLLRRDEESANGDGSTRNAKVPAAAVVLRIAQEFLDLDEIAEGSIDELQRRVARLKLGESLAEAFRLGLFKDVSCAPAGSALAQAPLGLQWYSTLEEIVAKRGIDTLSEADCTVCKSRRRKRLFEKQGFGFFRCLDCEHVYVSPRISAEVARQLAHELDTEDYDSGLMSAQKLVAAPICHLLKSRAPGPRLLDVGFGQGWILQLARSYGFEPYGAESSLSQIEKLRPQLGNHLHLVRPGEADFPWSGFDAVVISHVLEHLEKPDELLGHIFSAMNVDGVLYVEVPDIESLQFQVFGKRWDAITPLAHLQYFKESTLSRLLRNCLFTDLERVNHASISDDVAPRWMRLLRRLGGTDAGELAMICRRPAL
jgi:2-polyprenyl-3-methyl-5-hydroxy-6-metoxy-1,4-benzoquinol methylase